VLQTEAALERCSYELCLDSAAEKIDYLEVRWAPRLHLREGLTVEAVIGAVLRGLEAAPITAVAIVCAMRGHAVAENVELARTAGTFAGLGVVAAIFIVPVSPASRPSGAWSNPRRPATSWRWPQPAPAMGSS